MKFYFTIFLIFSFGRLFAQNFYISPRIERAFGISSYLINTPFITSSSYTIKKDNVLKGNGLSPLNLGFIFGYNFNSKTSLETGYFQDVAMAGYSIHFNSPKYYSDIEKTYIESEKYSYSTGVNVNRIPFLLQRNLKAFSSKSKINLAQVKANLGFSFLFKPKGNYGLSLTSDSMTVETSSSTFFVESDLYAFSKTKGVAYNFGISFVLNFKEIRLFDLNIAYQYSPSKFANIPVRITENGQTSIFRFAGSTSKLSVQLSRDFKIRKVKKKEVL